LSARALQFNIPDGWMKADGGEAEEAKQELE
jgi:hypothetical protein